MARWWANLVDAVVNHPATERAQSEAPKVPEFLASVETARREWLVARAYFDSVTDPDLIDHAIFSIEAAEKKYMYLLKRAKDMELGVDFRYDGERPPEIRLSQQVSSMSK